MSDPRIVGLMLMGASIAAFLGTTSGDLPSVTFFPALVLFSIGAVKFLHTNREAMAKAEENASRAVRPHLRENRMARDLADRQVANGAFGLESRKGNPTPIADKRELGHDVRAIEIELNDAIDSETDPTQIATDVSFPLEVQTGNVLADQLSKLNQLLEQHILTEEEYAIAKSKILG